MGVDEIKVLVADNSVVYKKMITQGVKEANVNTSVVSVAGGDEAFALIKRNNYDIIIVDAEISGLGLFELLKVIKVNLPRAFILVMVRPSSVNDKFFSETISKGATECMVKPIYDSYSDNLEIIKRKMMEIIEDRRDDSGTKEHGTKEHGIKEHGTKENGIKENGIKENGKRSEPVIAKEPIKGKEPDREDRFNPDIVLVAASTGGPLALETILTKISADFSVPILIIQHIPASFTESLARNLNQKSKIKVKVAENIETITAGTAYIAPGGAHMKLDSRSRIYLDDSPPRGGVRPAADVLFESVAEDFTGSRVLVVILTGMGSDGKEGLALLKAKKDCICLAQSEKTCVVYGMPRAVTEEGLTDKILDLDEFSSEIENFDCRNPNC